MNNHKYYKVPVETEHGKGIWIAEADEKGWSIRQMEIYRDRVLTVPKDMSLADQKLPEMFDGQEYEEVGNEEFEKYYRSGNLDPKAKETIRKIEQVLVQKRYKDIDGRLDAEEIEKVIKEYGGQIIYAPDEVYQKLFIGEVKDANPKQYWCDFDLWIDGKQSDLTASLTITEYDNGSYKATLSDVHVM